jgi:predicted DNA-binding transcriptional regulator YafY
VSPQSRKLERLLNLVAALFESSVPLTADVLRTRVGGYPEQHASFQRAFERDKDELRAMGLPIELRDIPGTDPLVQGYTIDRRVHRGTNPDLAPDELAALHVAASLVRLQGPDPAEDDDDAVDDALRKLGGVVAQTQSGGLATAVRLETDPRLAVLFQSSADLRLVRFTYRGTTRLIEPQRLTFARGHWYLDAFDRTKDADRQFRVDRIDGGVVVTDGRFVRRPAANNPEIRAWELGDDEPFGAALWVDAEQAAWATHELGSPAVRELRDDGSVVLEVQVRNRAAFRSFVLSMLDHAVVLEPLDLRDDIVSWLKALL